MAYPESSLPHAASKLHESTPGVSSPLDLASLLNEQQREAVFAPPGPALVIAGAGSGKTRTLTFRVVRLLQEGVPPWNILLLTFTNKAAREMLGRVSEAALQDTSGLWGGTFHSVGNRILRRFAPLADLDPGFTILDREDQQSLLRSAIRESGIAKERLKHKFFPKPALIASLVSMARNLDMEFESFLASRHRYLEDYLPDLQVVLRRYEERKRETRCVDFDDLLILTVALLEEHSEVLEHYQRQFRAILVDEYQDTNSVQSRFIDLLAARHRNLMVVGDDAQCIYSWRGADFRNILEFPERYPDCRIFPIETNYRSTPSILRLANASIAHNSRQFEKNLEAARLAPSHAPAVISLYDPADQAAFVCRQILRLRDSGVPLNEIAVLYRAHFHSLEIQMALERQDIPFRITSGLRFFDQAHIKDVCAFMRLIVNPQDEVSFLRLAKMVHRIGESSAGRLWNLWRTKSAEGFRRPEFRPSNILLELPVPKAASESWQQLAYTLDELVSNGSFLPPRDMIRSIAQGFYEDVLRTAYPNYERRMEDIEQFASYAANFDSTEMLLSDLSLLSSAADQETVEQGQEREAVVLSTVHQAKGLEWDAVFIVWLTAGMFPNQRALSEDLHEGESSSAVEEERRLFYVAATRARDHLYLTCPRVWPDSRTGDFYQARSPFLLELPHSTYEEWPHGAPV